MIQITDCTLCGLCPLPIKKWGGPIKSFGEPVKFPYVTKFEILRIGKNKVKWKVLAVFVYIYTLYARAAELLYLCEGGL